MRSKEFALDLPNDPELEREILGACFQEDRTPIADIRNSLGIEDFSIEDNRTLYRVLCALADRGDPFTHTAAWAELAATGHQKFGLGKLIDYRPDVAWALDENIQRARQLSDRRKLIHVLYQLFHEAADQGISLDSLLERARLAIGSIDGNGKSSNPETVVNIIESIGGITEFFKPRTGIRTPWPSINQATGGWNKGELALVAARSSMGKTSFALNVLYHAARCNVPSVFYSCEMTQESIVRRLISLLSGIAFSDLQSAELNASERRLAVEALATISDLPIRIIGSAGRTAGWITSHIERLKRKGLCELAILDYIGLVRGGDSRENRNHELGNICRQLKVIAAELQIPFMVLVQLNRALESRMDKRPMMSDMRDSGELEEHADLVMMLYRPGYYDRDNADLQGVAEVIIAKQRNGPTPIIPLRFEYHRGRFSEPQEN
jgi:replicative DNA helicase